MLDLDEADDLRALASKVARSLSVPVADLPEISVERRSIDARKGRVRCGLPSI